VGIAGSLADTERSSVEGEASSGIGDAFLHLGMRGAITSRDVLVHSLAIVRLFGPGVYVRCLRAIWSGRSCTFLEVLTERQ
jgi:hypothetical protein